MRWVLLFSLLVAGCSKGAEADLQYIKQARSLGAEWALINEQAAKGQLNRIYVGSMHKQLREQLQSSSTSLRVPDSRYAIEVRVLLREPDDASPQELRAHVSKLKQIEDNLESA